MSDVFISYARSTAKQAQQIAEALRGLGYGVWRDDELPAHRSYAEVIEERLKAAKAVVVVWSAEAVKSEWVQSEADRARRERKLVQLSVDGASLPMPFDRIQCADLTGWSGEAEAPGWRKVTASIGELIGPSRPAADASATTPAPAPLPAAETREPLLAVLAFDNLSGDPEMGFFSDGVSQEILDTIARGADLKVIARSSSFQLRGADKTVNRVASALKATHLLDGAVRRAGQRVRVSAQLVDCASETSLWSDRFDRELTDVFALQDEIAAAVAEALKTAFARQAQPGSTPPEAYERLLRAQALWNRIIPGLGTPLYEIAALLEPVVAQAPTFARAWELLAKCRAFMVRFERRLDQRPGAIDAAHAALRLDPTRVGGLVALAELEPVAAFAARERLLDQALALAPGDADLNFAMGVFTSSVGLRGGRAYIARARELDPLLPHAQFWYISSLLSQGQLDEGWRLAEDFRSRWPENPFQILLLLWAAGYGRWDLFDAWAAAAQRSGLAQHEMMAPTLAHAAHLRNPDPAYVAAFVAGCRDELARTGTIDIARLCDLDEYGLGDTALELAEAASYDYLFDPDGPLASRTMALSVLFIPRLGGRGMRTDSRFVRLCAKLGLVSYWLETDRWPDCADEVPYDFRAEARKAAAEGLARRV